MANSSAKRSDRHKQTLDGQNVAEWHELAVTCSVYSEYIHADRPAYVRTTPDRLGWFGAHICGQAERERGDEAEGRYEEEDEEGQGGHCQEGHQWQTQRQSTCI